VRRAELLGDGMDQCDEHDKPERGEQAEREASDGHAFAFALPAPDECRGAQERGERPGEEEEEGAKDAEDERQHGERRDSWRWPPLGGEGGIEILLAMGALPRAGPNGLATEWAGGRGEGGAALRGGGSVHDPASRRGPRAACATPPF